MNNQKKFTVISANILLCMLLGFIWGVESLFGYEYAKVLVIYALCSFILLIVILLQYDLW